MVWFRLKDYGCYSKFHADAIFRQLLIAELPEDRICVKLGVATIVF